MQNYGIFTHINVLQGFRAKEAKTVRKAPDFRKARSLECRDNQKFIGTKLKANSIRSVATIKTVSRQKLRRTPEETLEICRDITMIIATKQRGKEKKNVATSKSSITKKAGKSSIQDIKSLSR